MVDAVPPVVEDSILDTTKKVLGIEQPYTIFDTDIIMHINSVFTILTQLGVGPDEGFMIEDNTKTWSNFIGEVKIINAVKSYMYLRVRHLFDPPATSFAIAANEKQYAEFEWRLNVIMEGIRHPWPTPTSTPS